MMLSRRHALRLTLAGSASLVIPAGGFAGARRIDQDPHFFLLIVLNGGADPTYTFDARPLEMTTAGKLQNYLGKAPDVYMGSNGGRTLVTPLVKPLMRFADRFSVLNGVMMAPSFDGHLQNMNLLFTGDPFGGGSFVPHLNQPRHGHDSLALDAVVPADEPPASLTNTSNIIPLQAGAAGGLAAHLRAVPPPTAQSPAARFIRNRILANAAGPGRLSEGARVMLSALDAAPAIHRQLAQLGQRDDSLTAEQQCLELILEVFRLSISRSAIYMPPEYFDVHSAAQARSQPQLFEAAIGRVATLLRGLSETAFDAKRSMLDVTTVMVASEFGRTMRSPEKPIDGTGTNHNSLTNTLLLGGKGIRGGLLVGETDFASADEAISTAHQLNDPRMEKMMARPFDFRTMRARSDLPEDFSLADYLTVGSVINTLYSLFDAPKENYRTIGRDLSTAPVLDALIA
jgi:uncharacterized protein (DUF1501 family)